jgi:hypothetical protein
MKIDDRLSDIFDVPKLPEKSNEIIDAETGEVIESSDVKIESDYDKSRNNLTLSSIISLSTYSLITFLTVSKFDCSNPPAIL